MRKTSKPRSRNVFAARCGCRWTPHLPRHVDCEANLSTNGNQLWPIRRLPWRVKEMIVLGMGEDLGLKQMDHGQESMRIVDRVCAMHSRRSRIGHSAWHDFD